MSRYVAPLAASLLPRSPAREEAKISEEEAYASLTPRERQVLKLVATIRRDQASEPSAATISI